MSNTIKCKNGSVVEIPEPYSIEDEDSKYNKWELSKLQDFIFNNFLLFSPSKYVAKNKHREWIEKRDKIELVWIARHIEQIQFFIIVLDSRKTEFQYTEEQLSQL